jgi:hypothetical protein
MRTTTLNAYNAINLVRNGGLDMVGAEFPPFWSLAGADFGEGAGINFVTVEQGKTPDSPRGAANYFRIRLMSPDPASLDHEFARRFVQPAFVSGLGTAYNSDPTSYGDYHLDNRSPSGYGSLSEVQLIRGVELTLSASLLVSFGRAKISFRLNFDNRRREYDEKIIYPSLGVAGWVRPSVVFAPDRRPVQSLSIRVERAGTDISEIRVGDVMLAAGSYKDLPYTGDPFADAVPKGTIVFAFGNSCPPGFEKLSLEGMPSKGRAFLKNAASTSLVVEGEETHSHESAKTEMYPLKDWRRTGVSPGEGEGNDDPGDDALKVHTHKLEPASHVPPSRDVILCRRL